MITKNTLLICLCLLLIQNIGLAQARNLTAEGDSITADIFSSFLEKMDTKDIQMYITGEEHHCEETELVHYAMIEAISKRQNLSYVLLETGGSFSFMINKYLETGKEADLIFALRLLKREYPAYISFYEKIYQLNSRLEKKIEFVGLDVEHDLKGAIRFIAYIMDRNNLAAHPLYTNLDKIKEYDFWKRKNKKLLKKIIEKYPLEESIYSKDNTDAQEMNQLKETLKGVLTFTSVGGYLNRDKNMFTKFKDFHQQHPNDIYYFSIGSAHIMSKTKNIGKYVQDYLGKERVLISAINYQDCSHIIENYSLIESRKNTLETDKRIGLKENFTTVPNLWIAVNCVGKQ